MKKIYFLAVAILIGTSLAFGQTLTVSHPVLDYTGPSNLSLVGTVTITNSGSQTLNLLCKRVNQVTTPNHYSYFCWVACYDTSVSLSPDPITVPAGGSTSSFEGWMGTDNSPGHDEITYQFYDMNGLSDTLELTFVYDFTPATSIDEALASRTVLNITGSNPANTTTRISYTTPGQKNVRLVVTNLLGSKVSEYVLDPKSNSMVISVADLKSGVYIYSLVAGDRILSSKKLIVSHQ